MQPVTRILSDPTRAAELLRELRNRQDELEALLADLVAAPSGNPPGDTTGPARVVENFLRAQGLPSERIAGDPAKPNVVSTIESQEPGPHLVLNGHLDTLAPDDEDAWSVPLYALTAVDGRLFGIGTGNMKGAIAALLVAFSWLAARRRLWRGRISFTAVSDEVVFGGRGAAHLLEMRPEFYGDALICGEGPGEMGLAVGEKGVCWLRINASGVPGQGMVAPRGSSAIQALARVLPALDELNEWRVDPPPELSALAPAPAAEGLRVSANVGRIQGGRLVSQVATESWAELDLRIPPGLTVAAIEEAVAAALPDRGRYCLEKLKDWEPNWTPIASPIVEAARAASTCVRKRQPDLVIRLPGSDAARWRAQGVPAICFGPQPLLASGVDDFVFREDLIDCAEIYALSALLYFELNSGKMA